MFQTLEEYATECLPFTWVEEFKSLCRGRDNGTLPETKYCEAVNELVLRRTSKEALSHFCEAIRRDFGLKCSFTPHFIARLLARFRKSVADFLMAQIHQLATSCRKHKKERSRANGITLVMDPRRLQLITVFAS